MGVKWVTHNNVRLLYCDLKGLMGQEAIDTLTTLARVVRESPSKVRLLLNVEGMLTDPKLLAHGNSLGKEIVGGKSLKTAAVGIGGAKKSLLEIVNAVTGAKIRPFATEGEALDWLAE